jgi:hypothetical protein
VRGKDLGVLSTEKEWQVQLLWWNSETQSNWRDGLARSAILLDDPQQLARVQRMVDHLLATQDEDGYLGIYAPDLRFNFTTENGELWAQASLFRLLLGVYEATGEARLLEAVRRAVAVTTRAYSPGGVGPFTVQPDYAGVCHGLVFTDILDRLYQLTGQESYLDYALWLYQEYCRNELSAADIRYDHLVDPDYRFQAHGVHTYEQLRSLLTALYASGNPQLQAALDGYLAKLAACLAPSGAPIGDEMIEGRSANASETGYEYCSIHELLDSYSHLLQKTGKSAWADRIEWLLFNAGQGARHLQASAIAYLKTDTSRSMTGPLHLEDSPQHGNPQTRYKYSPAHQDVAVCCVPNAGRIYPYYVKAMWMRTPSGLVANLYGSSVFRTTIDQAMVEIVQETDYPFDLGISFRLAVTYPVEFELAFRRPAWADGFTLSGVDSWHENQGYIKIRRTWQTGDEITLRFQAEVKVSAWREGEFTLSYGPLLFALPLEEVEMTGRQYPGPGFRDLYYTPAGASPEWKLVPGQGFALERGVIRQDFPWQATLSLTGFMLSSITGRLTPVRLLPLGGTILRQATFKVNQSDGG